MDMNYPKILIVDDRPENLVVLESVLEGMEIEIVKASSGIKALSLMLENDFMLVILDVQMPEMDGFEVVDLMKRREKTRKIPVIFVTAISKEQWSVFRGYEVGAVDYLFKPIEPIILKSKVNVFIELYNQRELLESQKYLLEEKIMQLKQLKKENGELHNLSMIDGLTEISNRRSFDSAINSFWKISIREKLPVSLLLIDIDFFKEYNDKYGHIQGDECLRIISRAISGCLKRPLDYVARYGGEEFVVILPETDKSGAIKIGEEINKKIEQTEIFHEDGLSYSKVTISIGICTVVPNQAENHINFISKTDEALYLAKKNGRNRVEYLDAKELHFGI